MVILIGYIYFKLDLSGPFSFMIEMQLKFNFTRAYLMIQLISFLNSLI